MENPSRCRRHEYWIHNWSELIVENVWRLMFLSIFMRILRMCLCQMLLLWLNSTHLLFIFRLICYAIKRLIQGKAHEKIKSVLFSTLLAIGLVACGSESGDNSCATKTDTTSTTQQTTTTTATAQTECSLQSATPDPVVGDTMHEYHLSFDIPTGAVKR